MNINILLQFCVSSAVEKNIRTSNSCKNSVLGRKHSFYIDTKKKKTWHFSHSTQSLGRWRVESCHWSLREMPALPLPADPPGAGQAGLLLKNLRVKARLKSTWERACSPSASCWRGQVLPLLPLSEILTPAQQ